MHLIGTEIMEGLRDLMARYDQNGIVQGIAPMFQLYFTEAKRFSTIATPSRATSTSTESFGI